MHSTPTMEVRAHAGRAADLIRDREHWCTHVRARDKYDMIVQPDSDTAVRWCAFGALERTEHSSDTHEIKDVIVAMFNVLKRRGGTPAPREDSVAVVTIFNDMAGHSAILSVFDEVAGDRND